MDAKNLLLLFHRPLEPAFIAKGSNNTVFNIPFNYLTDRYKPLGVNLSGINDEIGETVCVEEVKPPNLNEIETLDRDQHFSLFIKEHHRLATKLIEIFLDLPNLNDLLSIAIYARDRINPYLFNYAYAVAILHRTDTKQLDVPRLVTCFPDKFFDSQVLVQLREEATIVPEDLRMPIEIPMEYTASDLEPEHRLAYFREDLGINLHHWHWHLVYPFAGPRRIVAKNRRGELFYYMHQQIVARYNCERLCNHLSRVKRYINWYTEIEEGYFPKLDSTVASRGWPARVANQRLTDVDRQMERLRIDIIDLIQWRDRIFSTIHTGFATDRNGARLPLTESEGIDILGNMIESSLLSPNREFYGDLHNSGHVLISSIHDPDGRHLETLGVMSDTATAMRDPIFYRWHGYLDFIFHEYKATLPSYTVDQLGNPGVTIDNVIVQADLTDANVINTFWQQSDVDVTRGVDFQPHGPLHIRFTHLQHQAFTYYIIANSDEAKKATCRIFISPKYNERRRRWTFQEQRLMFIELDRFVVELRRGVNVLVRESKKSSVTIPFESTFRDLDTRPPGGEELQQFNFCGCGWPDHMLIPKGTPEGYHCQLFVMFSNYEMDSIAQPSTNECKEAESYCGLRNQLYPDRRAMGYPFDRPPRIGVETLEQFVTGNMRVQDVQIRFHDRVLKPKAKFLGK